MATVIKRQIRATPHRTASESWRFITGLIAPDKDMPARAELSRVAGIFEQIIASEAPKSSPIVVFGSGPRLRLYCLYDEDAIIGDEVNENSLTFNPTVGDWKISVPALADDLKWVRGELKAFFPRFSVREVGDLVDEDEQATKESASVEVDVKAFLRS